MLFAINENSEILGHRINQHDYQSIYNSTKSTFLIDVIILNNLPFSLKKYYVFDDGYKNRLHVFFMTFLILVTYFVY